MTGILRRAEARGRKVLVEVMDVALSAITAADARGSFRLCMMDTLGLCQRQAGDILGRGLPESFHSSNAWLAILF
jgi:hypothetical protein